MRERGFEPLQALSYHGLNVTRLTAPAFPHEVIKKCEFKRVCFDINLSLFLLSSWLILPILYRLLFYNRGLICSPRIYRNIYLYLT